MCGLKLNRDHFMVQTTLISDFRKKEQIAVSRFPQYKNATLHETFTEPFTSNSIDKIVQIFYEQDNAASTKNNV